MVAKLIVTAGLFAANTALSMSRKIEGPRLDDLSVTSGDYGLPGARVWGLRRLQVPIIWAEELREIKQTRKTKGGKYNDYTYFGTWAVLLSLHEIAAVRRIWFDTHLVFDLSGAGPVTPFDFGTGLKDSLFEAATGASFQNRHIAIYPGSATQEPDPRMQAWAEARYGEGSCPAYRRKSYIVFKDIPLEKVGNRIPQVSVEFMGTESHFFPTSTLDTDMSISTGSLSFSDDFSFVGLGTRFVFALVDNAAHAMMIEWSPSPPTGGHAYQIGNIFTARNGSLLAIGNAAGLSIYPPGGAGTVLDAAGYYSPWVFRGGDADRYAVIDYPGGPDQTMWYNGATFHAIDLFGAYIGFSGFFTDTEGGDWVIGLDAAADTVYFRRIGTGGGPVMYTVPMASDYNADMYAWAYKDETHDHFVFYYGGYFIFDRVSETVSGPHSLPGWVDAKNFKPGAPTIWSGFSEYSLADLSLVRAMDCTDWGLISLFQNAPVIYDPLNHALVLVPGGGTVQWCYLDRVGEGGVQLRTIVEDVCALAGIPAEAIDASVLTNEIPGFSVSSGTGKDWLEPLLSLYDVDARPHGFLLEFLPRGGAAGATISSDSFAVSDGEPLLRRTDSGSTDVPVQVSLSYADLAADQQPGPPAESGPLYQPDGQRTLKLDMSTLALSSDEARLLVGRYHRRLGFDAQALESALTVQQIALEPGDVRPLNLGGNTITMRLGTMELGADGRIQASWRRDDTSIAVLDGATGAGFDARDESEIVVPLLSRGFALDVPYLSDADARTPPLVYALAAPYADGTWPGATLYQAAGGEYTDELATVDSSSGAAWGYVAEELGYSNPNLWDRLSEITVTLQTGTLSGCSEADIDADATLNLCAIGTDERWELVQFTTATLTATRTYTLSGFKRGRRGTEWAAEMHAAGDVFVLLDTASAVSMGLSEVGTDVSFKAITAGRSTGFPFGYSYNGASLRPYAPCHLAGVKDSGTGDWSLSWIRRTRVGGAWTSGTTIPLGEASEEYEVDIMDGSDVVRTLSGLTSSEATYTDADQVSDFGSSQSSLTFRVYQISDAVGRGFAAEASF